MNDGHTVYDGYFSVFSGVKDIEHGVGFYVEIDTR